MAAHSGLVKTLQWSGEGWVCWVARDHDTRCTGMNQPNLRTKYTIRGPFEGRRPREHSPADRSSVAAVVHLDGTARGLRVKVKVWGQRHFQVHHRFRNAENINIQI